MPVHKLVIASLITIAFVAFAYSATSIDNQSPTIEKEGSLATRIREFDHGGILYPTGTLRDGCVLTLYSREQFDELLELRSKEKVEYKMYKEKKDILERKVKEAADSGAPVNVVNEMLKNLQDLPRPEYGFVQSVSYYKIIRTGRDYVEVSFVESPEKHFLLPFDRIIRVELSSE